MPETLLLFFLHFLLFFCYSVTSADIPHVREKEELFPSIHRALIEYFHLKMTEFDSIDPPTTALPSAPITNPVTAPAVNTAPGVVTVPGTNPGGVPTPTTPVTNPVNSPVPVTNPINQPVPVTNPVNSPVPVTNPVNSPVPVTNPVTTPSTNPVTTPTTPSGRRQSWCVAKNGASQAALQSALDYACGIGGADCATIQQGSTCYEPVTLQNHASYAFNSYYQKNPSPTSCDFGGTAAVTTTNPSTGSCVYPSSPSSSSLPTTPMTPTTTTQAPVNPTSLPTAPTTSSSGSTFPGALSPPPGFSFGNNDPTGLGAFGASPPLVNTASSVSKNMRPFIVSLVIVASVIMFGQ